jgi:hypothetical protein
MTQTATVEPSNTLILHQEKVCQQAHEGCHHVAHMLWWFRQHPRGVKGSTGCPWELLLMASTPSSKTGYEQVLLEQASQ